VGRKGRDSRWSAGGLDAIYDEVLALTKQETADD